MITEYLKRSGTSRIVVRYDGQDANKASRQRLYLTLKHLPRIRELHIQGLPEVPKRLIRALFENPAPELENFTFATNSMEVFDIETLFNGQAPKLTGLSVDAILPASLRWDRASYMRHLNRICVDRRPFALQDIFSILSQSPELKHFSVHSIANASWTGFFFPNQLPIQIPLLTNLDIQNAGYETLLYLFRKVAFPNLTSCNIVCNDNPLHHRLTIPKSFMPRMSECSDDLYLHIKISGRLVSVNASSSKYNSTGPSQKMTYLWRDEIPIIRCFSFLYSVFHESPWCAASALLVELEARLPDAVDLKQDKQRHWTSLLCSFPGLRQLTLQCSTGLKADSYEVDIMRTISHYGVLTALRRTRKSTNNGAGARPRTREMICANLSELRLRGLDLSKGIFVMHLLTTIIARSRFGKRLAKLYITDAYDWNDANLRNIYECGAVDYVDIQDKNGEHVEVGTPSPWAQDFDTEYDVESSECGSEVDEDVYDYWG